MKKDIKKLHLSRPLKNAVLWISQPEQVEQRETSPIEILMQTYNNRSKQGIVKRKQLECVRVGENGMLKIPTNNWKGKKWIGID